MIIGLVGRSRVGKDTVAEMLSQQGYQVKRLAAPVKEACKCIYGWDDNMVESELKESRDVKWDVTPRMAMVHMTQSVRQFMGSDFFTRRFFDSWNGNPTVIPDVRYEHDVNEIHRRGGLTIKITRNDAPQHDFEVGVDSLYTKFTVDNNDSIDSLRNKISEIINERYSSCS
jgi:hypothetical protein